MGALSFWTLFLIVVQLTVAILGANINRSDPRAKGKVLLRWGLTTAALVVAVVQLHSQQLNAERIARLETLAPIEEDSGTLLFSGGDETPRTTFIGLGGVAVTRIFLHTKKSAAMDRADQAVAAGDLQLALREATAALDQDPNFLRARSGRAQIRLRIGDYAGAREDAAFVLDHRPGEFERRIALGVLEGHLPRVLPDGGLEQ